MNEISILQKELQNETNFNLFTKLLKRKIEGGMLSEEYLDGNEKLVVDDTCYVEHKVIFDCPYCNRICHINADSQEYECDCGNTVNLKNIKPESRYILSKKIYSALQSNFSQKLAYGSSTIGYIFGEKTPIFPKHDSTIHLHISPYLDNQKSEFQCIDDAYLDHFIIDWKKFPDIIDDINKIALLNEILLYRKESTQRQINWGKIDEWKFQNLTMELLESENIFSKIVPGGKGPDQGKDAIGYKTIEFLKGKPKEMKTLVQCKYTEKKKSFTKRAIESSITDAKSLNCNSLLFVTNGYLSGDAVTKMESGSYDERDFFGVEFWDEQKFFNLLEKYPTIRIKYFFTDR